MAKLNMANMNIAFWNIRNMASVNMLFRKGYLLAGVIMVANIFVVNEVRATLDETRYFNPIFTYNLTEPTDPQGNNKIQNNNNINNNQINDDKISQQNKNEGIDIFYMNNDDLDKGEKSSFGTSLGKILYHVLKYESFINLIGGFVFSGANNYFKWWNYDQKSYWELGCWGLRSGKFVNDIFQFEANINLGRGALWLVLHVVDFVWGNCKGKFKSLSNNYLVFVYSAVKGYISIPMTVHIPNFSFSISLDSLIFILVEKLLGVYEQKKKEAIDKEIKSLTHL